VTIYNIRNHISCFAALTSYTLQPGQSKADLWEWKQIYDTGSHVPFPADYLIRGLVPSSPALPEGFKTISITP